LQALLLLQQPPYPAESDLKNTRNEQTIPNASSFCSMDHKSDSSKMELPNSSSSACQSAHVSPAQAFYSRSAVVDALAGSMSGICGVMVGQPFDTIKVRQQTKAFSPHSGSSMISLIREYLHLRHAALHP
jgi:hypothetical protein